MNVNIFYLAGLIRTKARIDYEAVKQITFRVSVTDNGVPQLSATAHIVVHIININDKDPVFNETEYKFNIDENSLKGTSVGFVHAVDADDGNILYFL